MSDKQDKVSGATGPSGESDPIAKLKQMFVDVVQAGRIRKGQCPARRAVFLKPHGVAHGRFEIVPNLDPALKVGVFGLGPVLPAWVRFASDTTPTTPDLKTTLGIGIKLFGVPGQKLLGDGDTQDFLLQNMDVFFVDNVQEMCAFTEAGVIQGDYDSYLRKHPKTDRILKEMAKPETSCLTATYWSGLPYAFGDGRSVKYKLEPEQKADGLPFDDSNYLALDLERRLLDGEARFKFMVQFRQGAMPLDEATVRWSESESKPIHVATLVLPRQDVKTLGQAEYGENLAFNPWHCLPEHEPQGSISQARRVVYAASADERRNANGVPTREPGTPRPANPLAEVADTTIVRAAIHPAIGIARVGNSADEYFLAPEVTDPLPEAPGFYRDATGALKRQAARFRVYGLNAEGKVVAELTAENAHIHWSVHLANQKSAWYQFQLAQDIPEAADAPTQLRRNSAVADRSQLLIDPGPRHISGRATKGGKAHSFDTGKFMGKPVYLGELRTDEQGRLIVLGGHGKSESYNGSRAYTFGNNETFHDDTSDGPVTATVTYQGRHLKVDPAWIVVGPPNYAPQRKAVRTMWDLMRDVAISANMLVKPERPSFRDDILPIFERLSGLQWVNAGFAAAFGWGGQFDFTTPEWLARLSDNSPAFREQRLTIANQFRNVERDAWSPTPWPWLYGDAMNIPPAQTVRQNVALTDTQLGFLAQWAAGDFENDYDPAAQPPRRLEDVPVARQPALLDRASLDFCLADAFHPGCEMTWPMRASSMYSAPFRLKHAEPGSKEVDYGAAMTPDIVSLPTGPLNAQYAGGITRWMAVPWQTDTASCRSGYTPSYDPYVPSFWPARVPNQVLTAHDYAIVMDQDRPLGERLAAFANRAAWTRPLGAKGYQDQINHMIANISQMGVVEVRPGIPGDANFPPVMEVEDLPRHKSHRLAAQKPVAEEDGDVEHPHASDQVDLTGIEKVRRFTRRRP